MNYLLSEMIGHMNWDKAFDFDAIIEKVIYSPSSKSLQVVITPEDILHKGSIDQLQEPIKIYFPFVKEISFLTKYKNSLKTRDNMLELYWDNVLYELGKKMPSVIAWIDADKISFDDNVVNIIVKDKLGLDNLLERKIDAFIQQIYKNDLNQNVNVKFLVEEIDEEIEQANYYLEKEKETQALLKEILTISEQSIPKKKKQGIE
ncbi:MAG: hypothetical protein AB2421_18095, partial [Thermotaleaceae bacterium]